MFTEAPGHGYSVEGYSCNREKLEVVVEVQLRGRSNSRPTRDI
jgi:hypothetical protein